jgi:hypothetical protein
MDEMMADLISEGTLEGLEAARARGRTGGRKPKLSTRQITVAGRCMTRKAPTANGGQPLGGQQHNPSPLDIPSRRTAVSNTPLQHDSIRVRDLQ